MESSLKKRQTDSINETADNTTEIDEVEDVSETKELKTN